MKYCLYVSYDGLLDPLGQSQIIPYLRNLNKNGYKFIIFTYEKIEKNKIQIRLLKKDLEKEGYEWIILPFNKGKIHFLLRIIFGAIRIKWLLISRKINFVHLRGCFPGLIYTLTFSSINYLYDLRAFFGQWADGGITKYNSIAYKFTLLLERRILNKASAIVILDQSGKEYIQRNYKIKSPLFVIPTATDINKYKLEKSLNLREKSSINLVYLGGGRFPPYRIKDAITLTKELIKSGINCKIDFINKNEHEFIKRLLKENRIPKNNYSIKELNHDQIYKELPKYDVGLVFLEKGKWIRMSSPTKIGEYLAAGLIIIGNEDIAVLDRLSLESKNIETLKKRRDNIYYDKNKISNLIKKIRNEKTKLKSQALAKTYYSLENANSQYQLIYKFLNNKES